MKRLRLPIDWLVFPALMGTFWGGCFVAYGLFVWIGASRSGNPAAFAEVDRGVWIAGGSLIALAPLLWAVGRLGLIEWVRIQGGCNDGIFARYALAESDARPTAMNRALSGAASRAAPLVNSLPRPLAFALIVAAASPIGTRAFLRFLDWNPLGTVMIFGMEEGWIEVGIVAAGAAFLLWVLVDALARVGRLQRP
jgi:hypothetical protein